MLTIFTLAVAIIVGAVISLATNSWWFLLIALAIHAAGTLLVMTFIGKRLQQQDKPDPVTEAHEEAGDHEPPHTRSPHGAF